MNLSDYEAALRLRDFFEKLVAKIMDRDRPPYEYATVMSIDRLNRKAMVRFPTETGDSQVSMGSIQPLAAGQTVRVNGLRGDRFIEDVMGPAYIAGTHDVGDIVFSLALSKPGYLKCDGSGYSTTTYADLFALVGYTFGGSGATFATPDLRDRQLVGASVTRVYLGFYATQHTHTVSITSGDSSPASSHTHAFAGGVDTFGTTANHAHVGVTTGGGTTAGQDADHGHSLGGITTGAPSQTMTHGHSVSGSTANASFVHTSLAGHYYIKY